MAKRKAARSSFALPRKKMFPLNTKGRVRLAPGAATRAKRAGTISAAEAATVRRKAAAARKRMGIAAKKG